MDGESCCFWRWCKYAIGVGMEGFVEGGAVQEREVHSMGTRLRNFGGRRRLLLLFFVGSTPRGQREDGDLDGGSWLHGVGSCIDTPPELLVLMAFACSDAPRQRVRM